MPLFRPNTVVLRQEVEAKRKMREIGKVRRWKSQKKVKFRMARTKNEGMFNHPNDKMAKRYSPYHPIAVQLLRAHHCMPEQCWHGNCYHMQRSDVMLDFRYSTTGSCKARQPSINTGSSAVFDSCAHSLGNWMLLNCVLKHQPRFVMIQWNDWNKKLYIRYVHVYTQYVCVYIPIHRPIHLHTFACVYIYYTCMCAEACASFLTTPELSLWCLPHLFVGCLGHMQTDIS